MIAELQIAKNPVQARKLVERDSFAFFSGGTEINRLGSPVKAKRFVSLKNCALAGFSEAEVEICGSPHLCLEIGAMTTFSDILGNPLVPESLKVALRFCSSLQKRNMATIGGNIAASRDDSYLVPTLAAMNAHVLVDGENKPEFILDYCLANHRARLLLCVLIPKCDRFVASYRCANTAASHAVLTLSAGFCRHDGRVRNPIVAAAVKGVGILRLQPVEKELTANGPANPAKLGELASAASVKFKDDLLYGSAAYRKYLLGAATQIVAEDLQKMTQEAAE